MQGSIHYASEKIGATDCMRYVRSEGRVSFPVDYLGIFRASGLRLGQANHLVLVPFVNSPSDLPARFHTLTRFIAREKRGYDVVTSCRNTSFMRSNSIQP
jgi:hypothetical protein